MPDSNVDLTHRAFDTFNRRDWEAFVELMDADVVAETRLVAMTGGHRGHDGLRRWWDDLLSVVPDYTLNVLEVRDLGEATLSHILGRGHGAASETPVADPIWQPALWRDGKCVWWRLCASEEEGLDAIRARASA